MYTISRAAELTGVPVATLRAWERRYGIVEPHRTDGGYRLYDEGALARIAAMRDLVADGWLPKLAAEHVRHGAPLDGATPGATGEAGAAGPADGGAGGGTAAPWRAPDGVSGRSSRPGPDDADLLAAARDLDAPRVAGILDERFARGSFESVVDDWLMPALHAVGNAWASGALSTAAEHLVAHAVLRRLAAAFEAAARATTGPAVLVGLPPGCRHELGALAFATAARRAGLTVTYLGSDLPIESWLSAVAQRNPAAVVVPVPRRRDVPAAAAVLEAVREANPDVRVVLGGGHQDRVPGDAERLGHRIGPAAASLAAALAPR